MLHMLVGAVGGKAMVGHIIVWVGFFFFLAHL